MPNFDFVKESTYKNTFRNESIKGQFDLNIESIKEHFKGSINIEDKKWNVGLIVGFATVWSWLKPYSVLSNGEKMRVDLAKSILSEKEIIVFDEFTSVVDRTIAKTASFAIQKAIRKLNKKFVAVACHYDIVDWLEPDWIYDTNKKEFFFALENINDQKLKLKLEKVQQKNGKYLRNIII